MKNSFFIVAPELATVGQSSRAYLQRCVVTVLIVAVLVPQKDGLVSIVLVFSNLVCCSLAISFF